MSFSFAILFTERRCLKEEKRKQIMWKLRYVGEKQHLWLQYSKFTSFIWSKVSVSVKRFESFLTNPNVRTERLFKYVNNVVYHTSIMEHFVKPSRVGKVYYKSIPLSNSSCYRNSTKKIIHVWPIQKLCANRKSFIFLW